MSKINYIKYTYPNNSKKKKKIEAQTKLIIMTVLERCLKEKLKNQLTSPLQDYVERTSYYTGISKEYIHNICQEQLKIKEWKEPFLTVAQDTINKCLLDFYKISKPPKYSDIFAVIGESLNISTERKLINLMAELDYITVKLIHNNDDMVIEKPEIRFNRYMYLKKIKKHRLQSNPIYFVDVACINSQGFTKVEEEHLSNDVSVLFHMVSEFGYENGLFCQKPTHDAYMKWLVDMVIPILNPSSLIVLDDGNIFNQMFDTKITKYHSKKDMLAWLKLHNIPCNKEMHSAELYQLIENCCNKNEQFLCDKIFKAYGHEVLRIPKQNNKLSLTKLLHKFINKAEIINKNTSLPDKINAIMQDKIIKNELSKLNKIVVKSEYEVLDLDKIIENSLENFEIDPNSIPSVSSNCCCKLSLDESD